MPYSDLHRMAKGKWESTQPKMNNFSNDLAFVPDNEFVELLWENGQIVMHGQTSRTKKGSLSTGFSSYAPKSQQDDDESAILPVPTKNGRYGTLDSVMHDVTSSSPMSNSGLVQDDEMVPWLNYPLDDSFERDYCSEFFSELSGANLNSISGQTNAVPADKSGNLGQATRDSHMVSAQSSTNLEPMNVSKFAGTESESATSNVHASCKARTSQLLSSSQCQSSFPAFRLKVSDFTSNTHQPLCENSPQLPVLATGSSPAKMPQQDPALTRPSSGGHSGLMNFSHFSRPVALVKANLQNIGVAPAMGFSDKLRSNQKVSVTSSNPNESSMVESNTGSRNVAGCQGQALPLLPKSDLQSPSKPPQDPLSVEHLAICPEDASGNRSPERVLCRSSSFAASTALGRSESGKAFETVVTSSSVCSGNSARRASKDPKHRAKRKSQEVEESGYLSEDVEEESVDVKKSTTRGSTNAKRSRAAEVHNLSERRRRDRINEKMRALQELIPNCNKVDKASMLDEAIEYLKTLQLQVQIMSMGSGLCMPPVMLPPGMQHMHAPHMVRFSPMGVGMGMGMGVGFGMGMLDMSCTSGCPLIPVPSVHGAQLPCSPISGTTGLPGIPGSSLPMFRIPGQGLPMSMPCRPYVPLSGFSAKPVLVPDMLGVASTVPLVSESTPCSSSKDHMQNINLQKIHKTRVDCSEIQVSRQVTKECLRSTHQTSGSGSGAPNTVIGSGVTTNGTTS